MANPVLDRLPRAERCRILSAEEKARKAGVWPGWERKELPEGTGGKGWNAEVRAAYRNGIFAVLERPLPNGGRHLAVSSMSGVRPTWHEMQRIKSEIAGPEALAVEIYPPHDEIVDDADMFHIWVVPDRDAAPFDQFSIFTPRVG